MLFQIPQARVEHRHLLKQGRFSILQPANIQSNLALVESIDSSLAIAPSIISILLHWAAALLAPLYFHPSPFLKHCSNSLFSLSGSCA